MPRRANARRARHAVARSRSSTRARRVRPEVVAPEREPSSAPSRVSLGDALARIAIAAEATIVGLGVLARHARDREAETAKLASELVEELHGVASTARFVGDVLGLALVPPARRSTCERLRWEWVASTGALLDGGPAVRLRAECAVTIERTRAEAARLGGLVARDPRATPVSHVAEQLERRLTSALVRLETAATGIEGLRSRAFATM